jgi:hypothetical protein
VSAVPLAVEPVELTGALFGVREFEMPARSSLIGAGYRKLSSVR